MTTTVELDHAAIAGWAQPGGMVSDNMEMRAKRVVFKAQVLSPVRTGALRASGQAVPAPFPVGAWDAVFLIFYAWFVDQGTIYMDPRYYLTNALGEAIR